MMTVEFRVEDLGTFRRLHAKGSHTHEAKKNARICNGCYVDLPFSSEFLEQLVDWDSHGVFHFIEGRLCNDYFNEGAKRAVDRFCPDLTDLTVLDFGSGLGQLSHFFFERGASRVILAEIDKKLLELSRTYLEDANYAKRCQFLLIRENDDLSAIEDETIDLIVAAEVFEHILPPYRINALQRLYSKLRRGGIIILTAPNRMFPRDGHTTGLWFVAWLPPNVGAWYARTFAAWRWKGRSTEELLRQGLIQYSYFEARRVLKPLGAEGLCLKYPTKDLRIRKGHSLKARVFYVVLDIGFSLVLSHFGPWEAWQPSLVIAWSKPLPKIVTA